jgi:uncharacterized protein
LNYFTNLNTGSSITNEIGLNYAPRGANTAAEFTRQRDKTISAIAQLNADVVGLVEMENNGTVAIDNLVAGLNAVAGAGTYAAIADPVNLNSVPGGNDAIKVAFIYKPGVVTPVGNAIAANDSAFSAGRAPVAQTFSLNSNGEKFTAIANHFKSKGSSAGAPGDTDQGDGQGLSNATRKLQSQALLSFISSVQTSSGDQDVLVLGDLNAYNQEDPIDILRAGGLIKPATATDSYVFDGQVGSLDHALYTPSLSPQVTGTEHWNINSDEPLALDYNDNALTGGEIASGLNNDTSLYQVNPFRSSDHDPVLVGLNLVASVPNQILGTAGRDTLIGTAANETIIGRDSADVITGGGGNDTFVYQKINDVGDRITDFTVGDLISLGALFTSLNVGPFTYATATAQGFLGFLTSGSNTIVTIDRDGSAGSTFAPLSFITVLGVNSATLASASNFTF